MSIKNITIENFEQEVLNSSKAVLVDFWAPWCGPCRNLAPILDKLSEENGVDIFKVNVDEEAELASRYGVMSIPTIVVIKDGAEINRSIGLKSKQALLELIEN